MAEQILNLKDIQFLVDTFYTNVKQDQLLGPIFNDKIKDKWPEHLEKMVRFWQTILLSEHTYSGSPFAAHVKLPVEKEHFDRWLLLFFKTIDDNFIGEKATEAKYRAEKMAEMFLYKINYFREHPDKLIL